MTKHHVLPHSLCFSINPSCRVMTFQSSKDLDHKLVQSMQMVGRHKSEQSWLHLLKARYELGVSHTLFLAPTQKDAPLSTKRKKSRCRKVICQQKLSVMDFTPGYSVCRFFLNFPQALAAIPHCSPLNLDSSFLGSSTAVSHYTTTSDNHRIIRKYIASLFLLSILK